VLEVHLDIHLARVFEGKQGLGGSDSFLQLFGIEDLDFIDGLGTELGLGVFFPVAFEIPLHDALRGLSGGDPPAARDHQETGK
jgi:hypothetical protein